MNNTEKIIYSNSLGSVTDKRVILNYKSGTEDISLWLISSVRFKHKRNYFFSIGSLVAVLLLATPLLVNDHNPGSLIIVTFIGILFFILSGLANWIGHHNIVINVSGQNIRPLKVEMAKTKEGKRLVDAINNSISKHA